MVLQVVQLVCDQYYKIWDKHEETHPMNVIFDQYSMHPLRFDDLHLQQLLSQYIDAQRLDTGMRFKMFLLMSSFDLADQNTIQLL